MKITVRQLKTLIREAAAEAMDEVKTDEGQGAAHEKEMEESVEENLQEAVAAAYRAGFRRGQATPRRR